MTHAYLYRKLEPIPAVQINRPDDMDHEGFLGREVTIRQRDHKDALVPKDHDFVAHTPVSWASGKYGEWVLVHGDVVAVCETSIIDTLYRVVVDRC